MSLISRPPPLIGRTFNPDTNSVSIYINADAVRYDEEQKERQNGTHNHVPEDITVSTNPNHTREKFQTETVSTYTVPESVLQYERQMRKIQAADRAGSPVTKEEHLNLLYIDQHMIVVNKPSGVLCVPGVNNNPSMVQLVFDEFGPCESGLVDKMIVHRLDMDTSGVVVFARTNQALTTLQKSFRDRNVDKTYEALVCGQVEFKSNTIQSDLDYTHGLINLPLQRDHRFPPFMRVATPESESEAAKAVHDLQNNGWKKIIRKKPKASTTEFKILNNQELYQNKYPATRISLMPITGRTHQLRVHLAAIGHPIIGDPAYGIMGEASPNGGLSQEQLDETFSSYRASLELQRDINEEVQAVQQCMCLHAKTLKIPHPVTGAMMVFEADPLF